MPPYKRPDSKYWWMKFSLDGQLIQKSTGTTNKRDAYNIESAFRTQLLLGKIGIKPKPKAPAMKAAINDYLKFAKIEHAQKPKSYKRIEYSCQSLINFFGETKADKIEHKDIEDFIFWRSSQTSRKTGEAVTNDTINLELIALKTVFKRLISAEILSLSPARDIKQLPPNARKFHVLSEDEEKIYLMAAPQPLRDVAALMLETGMRPIEIYELKRKSVSITKNYLQIEDSKTAASNRKIWLTDKAAQILQTRLERFKGDYLFPKGEKDNEGPTYPPAEQHRETLNRTNLKFRLYDCRHTFATRALEGGTDLLTLASLLGHATLDELSRYAHPSETRKNEAIKQMGKREAKAV